MYVVEIFSQAPNVSWDIVFQRYKGLGQVLASIPGRIKIRPGTYCRGDSAHALQITQNMGNRTTNVKP